MYSDIRKAKCLLISVCSILCHKYGEILEWRICRFHLILFYNAKCISLSLIHKFYDFTITVVWRVHVYPFYCHLYFCRDIYTTPFIQLKNLIGELLELLEVLMTAATNCLFSLLHMSYMSSHMTYILLTQFKFYLVNKPYNASWVQWFTSCKTEHLKQHMCNKSKQMFAV